jgi:general nucleoside transport system ATP-binding protein
VLDNIVLGTEPLCRLGRPGGGAGEGGAAGATTSGWRCTRCAGGPLTVGERQRVEILKALYRDARILILDEPTAVLTPQEADALFATLRRMVAQGLSVIFISHKLHEVMEIADRCVVLRHGKKVGEVATAGDQPRGGLPR